MLDILPVVVIRMNEGIELPELKLECAQNTTLLIDLAYGIDDIQAMIQVTLMVVCQIVDKQIFEIELVQNSYLCTLVGFDGFRSVATSVIKVNSSLLLMGHMGRSNDQHGIQPPFQGNG